MLSRIRKVSQPLKLAELKDDLNHFYMTLKLIDLIMRNQRNLKIYHATKYTYLNSDRKFILNSIYNSQYQTNCRFQETMNVHFFMYNNNFKKFQLRTTKINYAK